MHQKTPAILIALGLAVAAGALAADNDATTKTFYDGRQFKMTVREVEPSAATAILGRNSQLHHLYDCDVCEPEGQTFVTVMDVIESDGVSPLWREVQIEFNPGYPCHQFTSDEQIDAAVRSGEISLNPTREVYRCSVVGAKD